MNQLLVITGPTATGKTGHAVRLAKKHQGELVSMDSRQAYQDLDTLSGKDLDTNSIFTDKSAKFTSLPAGWQLGYHTISDVPVWLTDLLPLQVSINVFTYTQLARQLISYLWANNRLPIVVGGSVQYIHHLINGLTSSTPPNPALRAELEDLSVTQLQAKLDSLSPFVQLNLSDRANPRRLIRAIERSTTTTSPASLPPLVADTLTLILTATPATLKARIDQRVSDRVQNGVEQEVKDILSQTKLSLQAETTLGLSDWQAYLEGEISHQKLVSSWQSRELAYAKRQLTYLKKYFPRANYIDISAPTCQNEITSQVKNWLG